MSYAMVFPGQGSQSVGMLSDLATAYESVQHTFAEAADALGTDLWALSQSGPAEELARTRITQPLMFTADVAVWRVLQEHGIAAPTVMAGHSLGEFAALVCAGAVSFADGLMLVKTRSELMSAAMPAGEGGMAALIGMDDEDVIAVCAEVSGDRISEAVNFNAPGQVAISGHMDAIERTCELAKERGARKAMILAVSAPNHSSLMRDAGARLAETIDSVSWQKPAVPVVQNADAVEAKSLDALLASLRQHVYSPVRWTQSVRHMRDKFGISSIVECGPGKVLTGLGKRIDKSLPTYPVHCPDSLQAAIAAQSGVEAMA